MDNPVSSWFSELGMEDSFFNDQYDVMDFLDEEFLNANLSPEGNTNSSTFIPISTCSTTLSAFSAMDAPPISTERPAKQQKSDDLNSSSLGNIPNHHNQPMILTFGNPVMPGEINPQQINLEDDAVSEILKSHGSFVNLEEATRSSQKRKKTGGRTRPASQTYDHIVAERKRREQLSQRFVALSTLVPGLKKMDKTSVLGDAISYLKHLQERVKTLEEQAAKQNMESMVLVKRSQLLVEDEGSSDEMGGSDEQPLPEIEAKLCNKNILLRVHCRNYRGVLVKILSEVEMLNLTVIHTSVAPFGRLALDVTLMAEMEKEFNLTMQELVKSIQSALQRGKQGD
ncbi:transcription factor bHLH18-like isoform X1 [Coffea eugenioides]|uniref:transcription factor bHLH18-like isoform X1 n=1 Tax=Coffea eugenioides TaxID=49369 RepID=UPI000F604581|nr:transcription factor bHLH18-like isoform X1 [Coffea eugenioides]XP_027161334.1 transcription factor bHLH18-like isoform X1 [Coffea eugenioides]